MFFKLPLDAFEQYKVPNRVAFYTMVPIARLQEFRDTTKKLGVTFKMRYRGPRFNVPSASGRSPVTKQTTCLLQDATHFSVYSY